MAEYLRVLRFLVLIGTAFSGTSWSKGAESYCVADAETGMILLARGEDTSRQVASLTKLATAVVVLEAVGSGGTLAEPMTVSAAAISGGANPLNLKPGDIVPVETALVATMMASDNTSTLVLAEHFGKADQPDARDPVAHFVAMMNRLASRLEMEATRFTTPHGIEEGDSAEVSTAADMARLAIHAYRLPGFPALCSEREQEVTFLRNDREMSVRLVNANELVGTRGIDGVKTGTSWGGGACLIASAVRADREGKSRRLIAVLLKSEDRFREAVILFNKAWSEFEQWQAEGTAVSPNESLRNGGM